MGKVDSVCLNCGGLGEVLMACDSDECPDMCQGHHDVCAVCGGLGHG